MWQCWAACVGSDGLTLRTGCVGWLAVATPGAAAVTPRHLEHKHQSQLATVLCLPLSSRSVMARGYTEPDPDYRPSRPTRRAESQRYGERHTVAGYSAHYAESPVINDEVGPPRTLPRSKSAASRSRNSTLPRPDVSRSASRASRPGQPGTTLSKVTRSRSWGARPGGVVVYNRHGEPVESNAGGQLPPSKAPSTIGVGYRPNTALSTSKSMRSVRSNGTNMTAASGLSTVKSKNTMKAGLAVETMSAPNPFCPNTKEGYKYCIEVSHLSLNIFHVLILKILQGVCCLMVLTNLSLILICIGFIIVLQLTDPPVVW